MLTQGTGLWVKQCVRVNSSPGATKIDVPPKYFILFDFMYDNLC